MFFNSFSCNPKLRVFALWPAYLPRLRGYLVALKKIFCNVKRMPPYRGSIFMFTPLLVTDLIIELTIELARVGNKAV